MALGVQPGQAPAGRVRHQYDRRVVHDGAELAYDCSWAPIGQPSIPALSV